MVASVTCNIRKNFESEPIQALAPYDRHEAGFARAPCVFIETPWPALYPSYSVFRKVLNDVSQDT